jgi:Caudovirus prohead serine protease
VKHKAATGVRVKATDQGKVEVVFATLNVVDHDGDVTLPGAFKHGQQVRVSAYNHGSWSGALPVGKGSITERGDEAVFTGQLFLSTAAGRDTFEVIKQLGDLGEWSYGYTVLDSAPGEFDGQEVQFLKALDVHEVSPVLLGAGVGTRTVAAKGATRRPTGMLRQELAFIEAQTLLRESEWERLSRLIP